MNFPIARLQTLMAAALMLVGGCETTVLDPPAQRIIDRDSREVVDAGEIVVLVGSRDSAATLSRKASKRGYRLLRRETLLGLDMIVMTFRIPRGASASAAIRELESMAPGVTAGVNHRYRIQSMADPTEPPASASLNNSYRLQTFAARPPAAGEPVATSADYAGPMIGWPAAGCPTHVRIGMIDARVDASAPGLEGAEIIEADFARGGRNRLLTEHGTAIAELLVGRGRLQGAQLYSAAVIAMDSQETASAGVDSLVIAIDWMLKSGVSVVNFSLAGPYNKILDRAVQRASDAGLVLVAAVGNDGPDSPPRYPAAFRDVIAVTAVDVAGDIYKNAVRGSHVDFAAPGVDILLGAGGDPRFVSGTSIAAPFVTARFAADTAAKRARSARLARAAIAKNARDLGPPGADPVFGAGLIGAPEGCENASPAARGRDS